MTLSYIVAQCCITAPAAATAGVHWFPSKSSGVAGSHLPLALSQCYCSVTFPNGTLQHFQHWSTECGKCLGVDDLRLHGLWWPGRALIRGGAGRKLIGNKNLNKKNTNNKLPGQALIRNGTGRKLVGKKTNTFILIYWFSCTYYFTLLLHLYTNTIYIGHL